MARTAERVLYNVGLLNNVYILVKVFMYSIFYKRDDFNFHVRNFPFLSSNIPASPAYGVFFSYLRQENSNERRAPTFSVWYRACLSGSVTWLSGTGCLALPFVLLFIYVSNYDVTTRSATFPVTSKGCRDVEDNICCIFFFKMHIYISMRYEKNNQVPILNRDRQISVSGDTMSHPSLAYRLDWYLWHPITLDWDLSVWIQHWYLILLISLLIWYARISSSYWCFIMRATWLRNKLLEQGYVKEPWNRHWGSFVVDTGIVSNNI